MSGNEKPPVEEFICLAKQAGAIIRSSFDQQARGGPGGQIVHIKGDKTVCMTLDRDIDTMVNDHFSTKYPSIDIVGEEGGRRQHDSRYMIAHDAVDGSQTFLNRSGTSAFCLALLERQQLGGTYLPIMSVIHEPLHPHQLTWSAKVGEGAFIQTLFATGEVEIRPLRVAKASDLSIFDSGCHVTLSSHHTHTYDLMPFIAALRKKKSNYHEAHVMAACGVRVADGNAFPIPTVASLYGGPSGLEAAAMYPIVTEAGGVTSDILGKTLAFDFDCQVLGHVMVSSPSVLKEVMELLSYLR